MIWETVKKYWKFEMLFIIYSTVIWALLHNVPADKIAMIVEHFGIFAPILFVVFYVIRGFFYIPSIYFLIASSILFMPFVGIAIYLIAIVISGTTSFYVGRYLRKKKYFKQLRDNLKAQMPAIETKGYWGVFISHVTGFSLDLPNYASGFFKLNYRRFIVTILCANIITTVAFYTIVVF